VSLFDAAERFASLDRSQIVLDAGRCLHSHDQISDCSACDEVCPVNAIAAGKPPTIVSELCQSCRACLPVCPVGAYSGEDDVVDLLNCVAHVEEQPVEILCGLHPQPELGMDAAIAIQIQGCLAGLGTGAYLTLCALGLKQILPRTDACQACRWAALHVQIDEQVDRAKRFLSAWDCGDVLDCMLEPQSPTRRPLWNAKNPPLSRRDLFRMMARQGQIAMARAMANGNLSSGEKPGRDRLRLLSAVSHLPGLPAPVDVDRELLKDLHFAALTVSEACTACGACAKTCPTHALKFEKNEEEMTFSLSFTAQNCIACDLCDHVCLPDAITLDHFPTSAEVFGRKQPMVVAAGQIVRCERCRSWIAKREGVKLCSLCEYRRTHPFGSMIPRKAIKESRS
jgi:Fe-S-cluster-containing hydrogenase component 2